MEMPAIVSMLVEAEVQQLMLPAQLWIDHRQSQGGTKKFVVPVLECLFAAIHVDGDRDTRSDRTGSVTTGSRGAGHGRHPAVTRGRRCDGR